MTGPEELKIPCLAYNYLYRLMLADSERESSHDCVEKDRDEGKGAYLTRKKKYGTSAHDGRKARLTTRV